MRASAGVAVVAAAALAGVARGGVALRLSDQGADDAVSLGAAAPACWKQFTYRGMGHLHECAEGEEKQMGICFPKCQGTAEGLGPVCLSRCPAGYEMSAGALCCRDQSVCTSDVVDLALRIPLDIAHAVADEKNPMALLHDLKQLVQDAAKVGFKECESEP